MSREPERATLSRERVVQRALELVDEAGLEACSVRALAGRLSVTPMAIYGHVRDKEDLLDGVLDAVLASIQTDDLPDDPIGALAELAHRYRAAFTRHPHTAPLLAARPTPDGPAGRELIAGAVALLRESGLSKEDAASAYVLLAQFIMGTVLTENEQSRRLPPLLGEIGLADLPDPDSRFEFALGVLVGGLRSQVGRAGRK